MATIPFHQLSSSSVTSNEDELFPFPAPECYLNYIDRGESLFNSVQILIKLRELASQDEKMKSSSTKKCKSGTKTKENTVESQRKSFEFSKDMFLCINTEAFIHVVHLLFEVYDSKETEYRFRDCWPVYERKMEGVFRRVVLEWIKEIIQANPPFFKGLNVETIGGLLINPGGDRFLKFILSFTHYVMFTVAMKNQGIVKKELISRPEYSGNSDIINRQLAALQAATTELMNDTLATEKKMAQDTLQQQQRIKQLDLRRQNSEKQLAKSNAKVFKAINDYPELFPTDVFELLQNKQKYLDQIPDLKDVKDNEPFELPKYPIMAVLEEKLAEKASSVSEKIAQVQKFCDDHHRLWYFLQVDRNKPMVLDGSKLYGLDNLDEKMGCPSLNVFFETAAQKLHDFSNENCFIKPVEGNSVQNLISGLRRLEYLKIKAEELRKSSKNYKNIKKILEFEVKTLSIKLTEVDWKWLSKCEDEPITDMLSLTPLKVFDVNRRTGYSPALNNFLSFSSSASSGESTPSDVTSNRSRAAFRSSAVQNQSVIGSGDMKRLVWEKSKTKLTTCDVDNHQHRDPSNSQLKNAGQFPLSSTEEPKVHVERLNVNSVVYVEDSESFGTKDSNIYELALENRAEYGSGDSCNAKIMSTPIRPDCQTEARIARLLESLQDTLPLKDDINPVDMPDETSTTESKFGNNSLLDDWENEKGIMECSMNMSLFKDDDLL